MLWHFFRCQRSRCVPDWCLVSQGSVRRFLWEFRHNEAYGSRCPCSRLTPIHVHCIFILRRRNTGQKSTKSIFGLPHENNRDNWVGSLKGLKRFFGRLILQSCGRIVFSASVQLGVGSWFKWRHFALKFNQLYQDIVIVNRKLRAKCYFQGAAKSIWTISLPTH